MDYSRAITRLNNNSVITVILLIVLWFGSCFKDMVNSLCTFGIWQIFKRWGLMEGVRLLGACPYRRCWAPHFSSLSCCILAVCSHMMCCLTTGSKLWWQVTMDWDSETVNQCKPFLLTSLFPQVFCYSSRTLTNTTVWDGRRTDVSEAERWTKWFH